MTRAIIITVLATCFTLRSASAGDLIVSADFENGSAVVDGIDQQAGVIRFRPGGDARRGWPCWWYFRVDGVEPGRTLTLELDRTTQSLPSATGAGNEGKPLAASWAQPLRAFYSIDGGKTWPRTEPGELHEGRMRYRQKVDAPRVLFAWGPRFSVSDAEELLQRLAAQHAFARTFELSKTREGRSVPGLIVRDGDLPDAERYGIWVQARQHAWESGGSWVGRGFIEWLTGDDPRAQALRAKSLVYYVPVMDVDSVATGNGGKGQMPQDHNRDWTSKPHFPEVAAAQKRIAELNAAKRFDLFVDLHNPAPNDKRPFFYAAEDDIMQPLGRRNAERFFTAAQSEIVKPMELEPKLRRSGPSYSPLWQQISKVWVTQNTAPHVVSLTLETSWNTPASDDEGYRAVGRQLGQAMETYFRQSPREE